MSVIEKYQRSLNTQPVSPKKISEVLEKPLISAEDILNSLPDDVVSAIESKKGNLKKNKLKIFMKSLRKLLADGYKPADLLKMDTECVEKNGEIDDGRLNSILNGEFDD